MVGRDPPRERPEVFPRRRTWRKLQLRRGLLVAYQAHDDHATIIQTIEHLSTHGMDMSSMRTCLPRPHPDQHNY